MTLSPTEVMARAMVGDARYDALPHQATYLQRKASTEEWFDREDLLATVAAAIEALTAVGYAVVPIEPTEAMADAGELAVNDQIYGCSAPHIYGAMISAHLTSTKRSEALSELARLDGETM